VVVDVENSSNSQLMREWIKPEGPHLLAENEDRDQISILINWIHGSRPRLLQ